MKRRFLRPSSPSSAMRRATRLRLTSKPEAFSSSCKKAFFGMSRSIRSILTSRLRAASSSRSAVVSAPAAAPLPLPLSMYDYRTHARTDVSVSSRSRETSPTVLSPAATNRTTSALYSGVKDRRLLFFVTMNHLSLAHSRASVGVHGTGARPVACERGGNQLPGNDVLSAMRMRIVDSGSGQCEQGELAVGVAG